MDKNIVALLNEKAYTVDVVFEDSGKPYRYISEIPLIAVGDNVVVYVANQQVYKVVTVIDVHDFVNIEPNSQVKYQYIVDVVDIGANNERYERRRELEQMLSMEYQNNMRKSFAQMFMAGLSDESRSKVQALLG